MSMSYKSSSKDSSENSSENSSKDSSNRRRSRSYESTSEKVESEKVESEKVESEKVEPILKKLILKASEFYKRNMFLVNIDESNNLKLLSEILDKLKLPTDKKYFTGEELFRSENFTNIMQELQNKRETKEKLTPYFQAIQRIENQFFVFREI